MNKLIAETNPGTEGKNDNALWRRWPNPIASIAITLSLISAPYYLLTAAHIFPTIGLDFLNIWCAARFVLANQVMVLFDLANLHPAQTALFSPEFLSYYLQDLKVHGGLAADARFTIPYVWAYPPHVLPWISVFGLFSYPAALVLWTVSTFSAYAFAVAYKQPQQWWLALVLLAAPASVENIHVGYTGFLIAAFLAGGLRLLDKRPILAGILFGFLTFKPQFFVLVPVVLIFGRHWRALAATAVTTAALVGFSVALFGIEPWLAFFRVILPYQKMMLESDSSSDQVRIILMVTPYMAARFLGAPVPVAYAVMGIFTIAAAASVAYVSFRRAAPALRNAVILTAIFFATPYAFVTDMTMLSAGIVFMLAAMKEKPVPWPLALLLIVEWLLPAFVGLVNFFKAPVVPLVMAGLMGVQLWWFIRFAGAKPWPLYKHR